MFEGAGIIELCAAHLHGEPVPVSVRAPDVSPTLERLVSRLLAKDPAERIQSAAELVDALDELLEAHPWTARDSVQAWERDPAVYEGRAEVAGSGPSGLTVDLGARQEPDATVR